MKNQMDTSIVGPAAGTFEAGLALATVSAEAEMERAAVSGGGVSMIPKNCAWCCCR
jgi:hypothetical protein